MSECPHGMPLYSFCEECSGPAPVEPDPQQEIADLKRRVAALERELSSRPASPKCSECGGVGQVSRAWGYIPCDACGGKGF